MTPAAVLIQSPAHAAADDARFALRELQRHWSTDTRVLVGVHWRDAPELLPADLPGGVLILRSSMLALDPHCLSRLAAALDQGADVALACDSSAPAPMAPPDYATVRGMERFVAAQASSLHAAAAGEEAAVEWSTRAGLLKRREGLATLVRVAGAWAHDASGYFASDRSEAIPLLPTRLNRLLDVGGGEGAFLAAVKAARPGTHTTLVELTEDAAAAARARSGVDEVWTASFTEWTTEARFDCISFLDVLEHLPDPEAALRKARSLLSPGGSVLMSIPNVGHASVVADLLEGRWDWAPVGIHCYTHVRFFTRHTIEALLARVGLQAVQWHAVQVPYPANWLERWTGPELKVDADSLQTYAYVLRAEPVPC